MGAGADDPGATSAAPVGSLLVNLDLRRAELALGRGDHAARARRSTRRLVGAR